MRRLAAAAALALIALALAPGGAIPARANQIASRAELCARLSFIVFLMALSS